MFLLEGSVTFVRMYQVLVTHKCSRNADLGLTVLGLQPHYQSCH